jgi:hypothetical protein
MNWEAVGAVAEMAARDAEKRGRGDPTSFRQRAGNPVGYPPRPLAVIENQQRVTPPLECSRLVTSNQRDRCLSK